MVIFADNYVYNHFYIPKSKNETISFITEMAQTNLDLMQLNKIPTQPPQDVEPMNVIAYGFFTTEDDIWKYSKRFLNGPTSIQEKKAIQESFKPLGVYILSVVDAEEKVLCCTRYEPVTMNCKIKRDIFKYGWFEYLKLSLISDEMPIDQRQVSLLTKDEQIVYKRVIDTIRQDYHINQYKPSLILARIYANVNHIYTQYYLDGWNET